MNSKNKVVVRIYGQEYTMVGQESREYMQKAANYVDDKMADIAQKSKKLSTAMVAVLTALNITDELFKAQMQLEIVEQKYAKPLQELEDIRSQLAATEEALDVKDMEYQEKIKRFEDEMKQVSRSEELDAQYIEKIEQLQSLIEEKERELAKTRKMNEELQNKLFDSQIKYVQARKELEAYIENFDQEAKR